MPVTTTARWQLKLATRDVYAVYYVNYGKPQNIFVM